MSDKEKDRDGKMTSEYRNVTVRTDVGQISCYMTDSSGLFAEELVRLGYNFYGIDLMRVLRPLPESMKPVLDKMDELACCLAITGYPFSQEDGGCIVIHRKEKGSRSVPLKLLCGDKIKYAGGTFYETLRGYREGRGMSEVDLYKEAGVSKQAFSKIRSGKVRPKRETVMTFAVALDLSAKDTEILLASAGYSLRTEDAVFVMEKAVGVLSTV